MHRKQRFKALWLVALAAVTALCLGLGVAKASAASSASPDAEASAIPSSGADKTVLRVGWSLSADSLNPFVGQATEAYTVYHLNYDFLVRYEADTLAPMPGLAESWSHSTDGKTWTFKLREGVTWQDGEPFTSKDVVFTYDAVMNHGLSQYANYTKGIKTVAATDDYTVVFTCEKPKTTMLQMWVPIVPEHIWSKIPAKDRANKFQNKPPVIGTGAFQVVDWKPGVYVRMKANPNFYGGKPKVDEIIFSVYTNSDTMASDLSSGLIQFADVTPAAFQKLKNQPGMTALSAKYMAYDDIGFNCYDGPYRGSPVVHDAAFRRAVAWGIDTETIASIAYGGAAAPATSILPSGYWPEDADYHWEPSAEEARTYDPAKAKSLLDEAGYADTDGDGIRDYKGKPIKLRLWASTERPELGMAGKLVAGYLKDLGLQITYQTLDPGAMNEGVYGYKDGEYCPDFDMFCWGWAGDYDPGFLLSLITTDQIEWWSDTAWSNPEYDRLYEVQDGELDTAKRLELVHQMQQILYEECPYIPTVYRQSREVYNSGDWTGWVQMPAKSGGVDNRWTYNSVHPQTDSTTSASSGSVGVWVAVGVAAAVVVIIVAWVIVRRRRRTAIMEAD